MWVWAGQEEAGLRAQEQVPGWGALGEWGALTESSSPPGGWGPREAPPSRSPHGQTRGHLQWGDQEEAVHSPGPAGETRPSLTGE